MPGRDGQASVHLHLTSPSYRWYVVYNSGTPAHSRPGPDLKMLSATEARYGTGADRFPGGIGGRLCWVDMPHMADAFPGAVMRAELIDDAEMHRPARHGFAWVRQVATPAQPYPGEEGGWVSEQPWSRID